MTARRGLRRHPHVPHTLLPCKGWPRFAAKLRSLARLPTMTAGAALIEPRLPWGAIAHLEYASDRSLQCSTPFGGFPTNRSSCKLRKKRRRCYAHQGRRLSYSTSYRGSAKSARSGPRRRHAGGSISRPACDAVPPARSDTQPLWMRSAAAAAYLPFRWLEAVTPWTDRALYVA